MRAPIVAVAALALVAAGCGTSRPSAVATDGPPPCRPDGLVSTGEQLPDCAFERLDGEEPLRLADLRGTPTVINFWASWCANCIIEMPAFEEVHQEMTGRVRFVGMNFLGGVNRETRADAERFARKTGVTYDMAYDPDGYLYSHFQPNTTRPLLPATVFVGSDGAVRRIHFGGPVLAEELRALIAEHLGIE